MTEREGRRGATRSHGEGIGRWEGRQHAGSTGREDMAQTGPPSSPAASLAPHAQRFSPLSQHCSHILSQFRHTCWRATDTVMQRKAGDPGINISRPSVTGVHALGAPEKRRKATQTLDSTTFRPAHHTISRTLTPDDYKRQNIHKYPRPAISLPTSWSG